MADSRAEAEKAPESAYPQNTSVRLSPTESVTGLEDVLQKRTGDDANTVGATPQVANELNELTTEIVKSSIDLAVSEHRQEVAVAVNSLTDHVVTDTAIDMEVRERAMSLADKVLTSVTNEQAQDKPISECGTLGEMGADSVFEYSGDTYLEPVSNPYNKAIGYLEKHSILQLFQGLTSSVVLNQPSDPLEAMLEQLNLLKNPEPSEQSINLSDLNVSEKASA